MDAGRTDGDRPQRHFGRRRGRNGPGEMAGRRLTVKALEDDFIAQLEALSMGLVPGKDARVLWALAQSKTFVQTAAMWANKAFDDHEVHLEAERLQTGPGV